MGCKTNCTPVKIADDLKTEYSRRGPLPNLKSLGQFKQNVVKGLFLQLPLIQLTYIKKVMINKVTQWNNEQIT